MNETRAGGAAMRSAALEGLRNRALACDMVETAVRLGARLKRAGAEWTGPCPYKLLRRS